MRFLAFLLISFFITSHTKAQSLQLDSLKKVLSKTSNDTLRAKLLNKLSEGFSRVNPDSAFAYAQAAYKVSVENGFKPGMAESCTNRGWISINTGKIPEGYEFYQEALQIFTQLKDEKGKAIVYNGLGVTYAMQERFTEAMRYFLQALAIQQRLGSPIAIANSYIKIGLVHQQTHEDDKALASFEKALQLAEKAGDKRTAASAYSNIGMLYGIKEDYKKSLQATIKAKELSEELQSISGAATAYLNIGLAYSELKQFDLAEKNLNKALTYSKQLKNPDQIARVYNGLGNLYLYKKQYSQAEKYVQESNVIAVEQNKKSILYDNYELLTEISNARGDYKNSVGYYNKMLALKDTLFNSEKNNAIEQLNTSHQLQLKQETIEALKKDNISKTNQRNTLLIAVSIAGLLMLLLVISFINIKRKNSLILQREKELRELNTMKDKFFSILSHDLRSPLSNILLSLELFGSDFSISENERKFLLEQLKVSTSSALETMDNMLAWGQHQLQHTTNVQKKINLQELAERVCRFLQHSASNKSITIVNKINEPHIVTADENQLEFILRNLLSNSLKFSHKNDRVEIWANKSHATTSIYVKDFGTGMSTNVKEQLFTPASVVSKKGTSGEVGSGLGLMLSRQFISENNGELLVESEEGKGTTFEIQLPVHNN